MKPGRGWKNGKGKRTSVEACEGGARSKEKRAEGKGRRHANANVNVEERRYGKCGYAECMAAN